MAIKYSIFLPWEEADNPLKLVYEPRAKRFRLIVSSVAMTQISR